MATLEKIRNKSVMLIVVIGVALLAFILGDFFSSSKQFLGSGTTVAKVGGSSIDIQDFQKMYNEQSKAMAQNQDNDAAVIQQDILDQMINDKMLEGEFDNLGIEVSSAELSEFLVGKYASQTAQLAQSVGVESPAQLYDMIFNPAKYNIKDADIAPLKQQWLEIEKQTETMIKRQLFATLIMNGVQANKLDAKAIQDENNIYNITFAKKDYASLKDADFKPTDAELKAEYDKVKNKYQLNNEIRKVNYISVDIVPSAKDLAEANALFNKVVTGLNSTPGLEAARAESEVSIEEKTMVASKVPSWLTEFVANATVGAVSAVNTADETLQIAKVSGIKMESDSVKLNMVAVEGNKAVQDSILKLLNNGTSLDDIAKNKSVKGTQKDQDIDLSAIGDQDAEAKNKVLNAGAEYFVINSNENAASICQVTKKSAPKKMISLGLVSYKLIPSDDTKANLLSNLEKFIAKNNTSDTFVKNAAAANYTVEESYISADMPRLGVIPDVNAANLFGLGIFNIHQVQSVPNTRSCVVWAFDAKEGEVSQVFDKEGNDKLVVVAVNSVFEKGYVPMTEPKLREELTKTVIKNKKAEKLIATYKGKANNVTGYAAAMSTAVDTAQVAFANGVIPTVGLEPNIVGAVAGTNAGKLVGPMKGNNGVFVFQVASQNKATQLSKEEAANRFNSMFGGRAVIQSIIPILRYQNPVKNKLNNFYNQSAAN